MTVHPPPTALNDEPPISTRSVLTVGLAGVGLGLVALVAGLVTGAPLQGFEPHSADGIRVLLAVTGLLVAGCAISMRPGWYGGWLCAAGTALLGYGLGGPAPAGTEWYLAPPRNWYAGVPNSWDSIQIFFGVGSAIALIGAVWTRLPKRTALTLIMVGMTFHWLGILSAITSPAPTPWLTQQYYTRVSRPYLQFAYLNNAYQFYSPDPGAATEIWACIDYRPLKPGEDPTAPVDAQEFKDLQAGDDPDVVRETEWVYIPRRPSHYIDPLGLSFYRRLAITENITQNGVLNSAAEHDAVLRRREAHTGFIPRMYGNDAVGLGTERRVPSDVVSRQLLPSYVRHLAHTHAKPDRVVKSIRVYRALHLIANLGQFHGYDENTGQKMKQPMSPYNPTQYMPYYQGKYDRDGRLTDPTDPMLYWLLPIIQEREVPEDWATYKANGGYFHYYTDNVSRQAGSRRPQE